MSGTAWVAGALGVLGVLLGAVLSLGTEWFRRRWHRTDTEIERRQVRSEAAAREALVLVGVIEGRLRRCRSTREVPSQKEMVEITRPIRDVALLIGDPDVRSRLESIAAVTEQLHSLEALGGYEPNPIASAVGTTGRNAVAHVLSGEPLSDRSPMAEYMELVEEHWRWMEEVVVENRAEPSGPET